MKTLRGIGWFACMIALVPLFIIGFAIWFIWDWIDDLGRMIDKRPDAK